MHAAVCFAGLLIFLLAGYNVYMLNITAVMQVHAVVLAVAVVAATAQLLI